MNDRVSLALLTAESFASGNVLLTYSRAAKA